MKGKINATGHISVKLRFRTEEDVITIMQHKVEPPFDESKFLLLVSEADFISQPHTVSDSFPSKDTISHVPVASRGS